MMKTRSWSWIAIVIALGALLAAGCGGSGPGQSFEDFLNAGFSHDCDKIVDLIYTGDMSEEMAQEAVDTIKSECEASPEERGELTSFEVLEENIDGDTATVKYKASVEFNGDEETDEDTITMHKVDGTWKVALFE